MPTDIADATTGATEYVFPGDLEGLRFDLLDRGVYSAFEVRQEQYDEPIQDDVDAHDEGQTPAFGRWLRVDVVGNDDARWMIAPGELIDELKTWDDPTEGRLRVTRCRKSGPDESDPYEVNVAPDA